MEEPSFVTYEELQILHAKSLKKYGGSEGIRDQGLIESALGAAQNTFFYAQGDLFDIAASYAFHIAQAQAFLDGNKRTAISAALTFLKMNLYDAMIAIAEKRLDKTGLAELFRKIFQ